MGNVEVHDLAPKDGDNRKELNLSRKVTHKQFVKVSIFKWQIDQWPNGSNVGTSMKFFKSFQACNS